MHDQGRWFALLTKRAALGAEIETVLDFIIASSIEQRAASSMRLRAATSICSA